MGQLTLKTLCVRQEPDAGHGGAVAEVADDGVQVARPLAQPLCCLSSGGALCKVVVLSVK